MSESSPFIVGGIIKTDRFKFFPNRGENRRQNEIKKNNCFTWVIFQIAKKMVPLHWLWASNLYHNINYINHIVNSEPNERIFRSGQGKIKDYISLKGTQNISLIIQFYVLELLIL